MVGFIDEEHGLLFGLDDQAGDFIADGARGAGAGSLPCTCRGPLL